MTILKAFTKKCAFVETNGIYFLLSHTSHEVLVLLTAECSLSSLADQTWLFYEVICTNKVFPGKLFT